MTQWEKGTLGIVATRGLANYLSLSANAEDAGALVAIAERRTCAKEASARQRGVLSGRPPSGALTKAGHFVIIARRMSECARCATALHVTRRAWTASYGSSQPAYLPPMRGVNKMIFALCLIN